MDLYMTVMQRKKQLIGERVDTNADALRGLKITRILTLVIIFSRLLLSIYDAIYLSSVGANIPWLSYVFFLLGLIVCYLMLDGNRAVGYVLFIAGIIRIFYHLSTVMPNLEPGASSTVFTVITLTVLVFQAVLSLVPTVNKKCIVYSNEMQKINYIMQQEISNIKK